MEGTGTESSSPKASQLILSQTFSIGGVQIHYYGIILAASILLGYFIAWYRAPKFGFTRKFVEDISFWTVVWGIVGARLYYVLFYPQFYRADFWEIFRIWHGGQSIYGALIGGALTIFYFARKHKIPFLKLSDFLVFSLPLAQALGRLGNFVDYQAFGLPTNLPWKMFVPQNFRPAGYQQYAFFHPTFAYEMLWDVFVFVILILAERYFEQKKSSQTQNVSFVPKIGTYTAIYLLAYSVGRFFIEGIRLDSAFFGPFRGDQITALLLILLSLGIMAYGRISQKSN